MPTQDVDVAGSFSWSELIARLSECLSEKPCSLEETCSRYGYLMSTFYSRHRITVMVRDFGDDFSCHLVFQEGFPAEGGELAEMVRDNETYMKPFLTVRRPRFLEWEDYSPEIRRSRYGEACAAHIPICSVDESYGWLTISSVNPSRWSRDEREWLPVTGCICGSFIARALKERGAAVAGDTDEKKFLAKLTPREVEVLGLIAQGKTNSQISEALFISESTARKHVENIYSKLEVKNRPQAMLAAKKMLGL